MKADKGVGGGSGLRGEVLVKQRYLCWGGGRSVGG